ncbi:MAG TPA: T9SS type A sorting domain-containing protein [bacterium]|nr:T9SS type A sorting domain-containing protein [bacterium]
MKRIALLVFVVAVTSICSGQWLERQVVIGDTFGGISLVDGGGVVVNPISGSVYIESNPVQIFNPVTMQKLRNPGTSGRVIFCPPGGKGYVVSDSLVILGAVKDEVIGTALLPFAPDLYVYSRTSNRLYFGSYGDPDLVVFDPDGDSIQTTVTVGFDCQALLWDTTRNRVYIGGSTDTTAELGILDCSGDTMLPGIETGLMEVKPLALSTVSHKIYCWGVDSNDVSRYFVVSTDSLKVVDTLPALSGTDVIAYSPTTDRLYAANYGDTEICIVDCRSDAILATRDVGMRVSVMTASSLTGKLYVASYDSSLILVMDTTDAVIGSVLPPSARTDAVTALTFRPDRNRLYGVTGGSVVFTIDAGADTVLDSTNYATVTATKMIHNPAGNKLYAFCPGIADVLVFDTTFGTPKHIRGGVTSSNALPVLNPALNRIYVADANYLRVIDCNSDSLLGSKPTHGISHPLPVMVPYLNKLYVFPGTSSSLDPVFAYDVLKDTVTSVFALSNDVPCAVYDQRSNRIFLACQAAPTIRVLDPATDSVVKTLDLGGGSNHGRMALNPDLGRLYYTDQGLDRVYTIDVLGDSVIASQGLPWNIDTMFLDRRLGKLFLCSRTSGSVLVFDCGQGAIVDTLAAAFRYAGLMNDRNDKLYLRYGAVVDCRYDSVVTLLPPGSQTPRSMAWDAIDNRVFQAPISRIYVYRDNLNGIEDAKPASLRPALAVLGNPVRNAVGLRLQIPRGQTGSLTLCDVAGRLVRSFSVARTGMLNLDLRSMSAGVYFVRLEMGASETTTKIIVQH